MASCEFCGADDVVAGTHTCACLYCGYGVSGSPEKVPDELDDDGWNTLAAQHAPNCEWITSKAHQLPPSEDDRKMTSVIIKSQVVLVRERGQVHSETIPSFSWVDPKLCERFEWLRNVDGDLDMFDLSDGHFWTNEFPEIPEDIVYRFKGMPNAFHGELLVRAWIKALRDDMIVRQREMLSDEKPGSPEIPYFEADIAELQAWPI